MKENKKLEEWNDFAKEELFKAYKKDDAGYVLSCYNQNLTDSMDK